MSQLDDLASRVTVVILGGGRGTRLNPLTKNRAKPAVPVAGKFRLIDIPISNAINSRMDRMYVLTQFNSVSLHRHIARTYRFGLFSRGYVQILAAMQTQQKESWFQGTADAVRQHLRMFKELQGDHILILAGDHMYRMDYRQLLLDHTQQGADITIGALPCSQEDIAGFGALRLDDIGRVVEFREKPTTPKEQEGMAVPPAMLKLRGMTADRPFLASMGIYIFRKECLAEALDNTLVDFGRDIIPAALSRYRVHAHFFDGYWRDIGTTQSFFQAHMDLVKPEPPFTFHDPSWVFYTRPRYLPGARLHNCCFDRVLLADGTRVQDSDIKEGVLGLRTNIIGARIRRALIMGRDTHYPSGPPGCPPVGIGEGTEIQDAIIDKNARIGKNVRILNEKRIQEADGDGWTIRDGIVVVPKNAVIPDGTVI